MIINYQNFHFSDLFQFIYKFILIWNRWKKLKSDPQTWTFSYLVSFFWSAEFNNPDYYLCPGLNTDRTIRTICWVGRNYGPISSYVPQGTCLHLIISSEKSLVFYMLGQMFLLPVEYSSWVRLPASHRIFFWVWRICVSFDVFFQEPDHVLSSHRA